MAITKDEALENLDLAISDCETFDQWDTNDASNFESMSVLLKQVKEYIEQNP